MRPISRKSVASRQASRKAAHRPAAFLATTEPNRLIALVADSINLINLPASQLYQVVRERSIAARKSKSQLFPVLYNNRLLYFNPTNKYLANPEQLWLIESLMGTQALHQALSTGKTIDSQFIERLFAKAPFAFYLSSDEAYLVTSDDELTQLDFGPLTKISALTALQRFSIALLERAKEKTVARL